MGLDIVEILARALVCVVAVVVLTRLNGLRSFSKMSSFDFAITVACGSVIASSVISPDENLMYGIAALTSLFIVQWAIALLRECWPVARQVVDNRPIMIMKDGEILHENLRTARMTTSDLYGKLREANAFDLSRVRAVIFEPTGDVSVLHGTGTEGEEVSADVLQGVRQ